MSAADRMRRYRARRREGAVVARMVLHNEAVDELAALGWVQAGADPQTVRKAVLELLEAAMDRGLRRPA